MRSIDLKDEHTRTGQAYAEHLNITVVVLRQTVYLLATRTYNTLMVIITVKSKRRLITIFPFLSVYETN